MGTEIAISFNTLREQLESEKNSLCKIDENIKKIVQTSGRFTDRFNASGDHTRANNRAGGRNSHQDVGNNYKNDDQLKRKHETKTVFSRLSARVHDSEGEEDNPTKKTRMSSAVSRELPSRAAILRAQGDDEQARTRNRRIFSSLLGTLQKFKQEEIVLQTKEDKKAQVERKIEEQARLEKEREQKERKTLFVEREHKKATIKALEAKMARVQEFEKWEASQQCLGNFILTKSKPHVYWIPKNMSEKAAEKLESSRKFLENCMTKKREELQEELQRIEKRCLRVRPFKENVQENHPSEDVANGNEPRKRDKFAMDVDEKDREDSEPEEKHDEPEEQSKVTESEESKMDTNTEQTVDNIPDNKTIEADPQNEPANENVNENAEENNLNHS